MLALKLEDEKFAEPGKKERELINGFTKGPTRATPSFLLPVSKLYIHLKEMAVLADDPDNLKGTCVLLDSAHVHIDNAVNDKTTFEKLNTQQQKQVIRLMNAISDFLGCQRHKMIENIRLVYKDAFEQLETIPFQWYASVRFLVCELLEQSKNPAYMSK
jgi:hypothetical protein